jgi:hypothetical protein
MTCRRCGQFGCNENHSSRGERVLTALGVFLVLALVFGAGALYGHWAYGDWKCGFSECRRVLP